VKFATILGSYKQIIITMFIKQGISKHLPLLVVEQKEEECGMYAATALTCAVAELRLSAQTALNFVQQLVQTPAP
jgi:hypothetical protein